MRHDLAGATDANSARSELILHRLSTRSTMVRPAKRPCSAAL
jgi:hypothetical protein